MDAPISDCSSRSRRPGSGHSEPSATGSTVSRNTGAAGGGRDRASAMERDCRYAASWRVAGARGGRDQQACLRARARARTAAVNSPALRDLLVPLRGSAGGAGATERCVLGPDAPPASAVPAVAVCPGTRALALGTDVPAAGGGLSADVSACCWRGATAAAERYSALGPARAVAVPIPPRAWRLDCARPPAPAAAWGSINEGDSGSGDSGVSSGAGDGSSASSSSIEVPRCRDESAQ